MDKTWPMDRPHPYMYIQIFPKCIVIVGIVVEVWLVQWSLCGRFNSPVYSYAALNSSTDVKWRHIDKFVTCSNTSTNYKEIYW